MKNNVSLKGRLCGLLNKHFGTIERYINKNEDNGPLTTMIAIEAIKETLLLDEEDILLRDPVTT